MAKQRIINTRFWIDDYTSNLDPIEKLLFLYLLTNTATEICGVYELPLKIMAVDTGIDKDMVEKILKRFEKDSKILYIDGWVCIINFTKHQTKNPSVELGIKRCFSEVPSHILEAIHRLSTATPQLGLLNLTKLNLTKPIRSNSFQKPSINEIREYLKEKQREDLTESFYNFYESNGWKVGRNKMKDWKATCRGWISRDKKPQGVKVLTFKTK